MEPDPKLTEELFGLCEQRLEGRLSAEGLARLEELVRNDQDARRAYVEYIHQHASLYWTIGALGEFSVAELEAQEAARTAAPKPPIPFPVLAKAPARRVWLALAASIVLTAGLTFLLARSAKPSASGGATFARLVETKNSKWGQSSFPTEVGSRLGAGRMRLLEGIAIIGFDQGVRVSLEAPSDLELVSSTLCILRQGVLVAKAEPGAAGFVVETPTAKLVDFGTEFGVTADGSGETQVQVLEGIVDVQHLNSGKTERLTAGKNSRVSTTQFAVANPNVFESPAASIRTLLPEVRPGTLTLTTASGGGKDAYVQTDPADVHGSEVLLLVKNAQTHNFQRKAYLGFDLTGVAVAQARDVRLSLTMEPSGYGYTSFQGDSTFGVYGLTDQSLDRWTERTIGWDNAPANMPSGAALDPEKTVRLGSFEAAEGVTTGEFTVSGEALASFLRADTNSIVTFIVVRETPERRSGSVVHGFVSKRHPMGSPPTLRISL